MKSLLIVAALLVSFNVYAQEEDVEPSAEPVFALIASDTNMHDAPAGATIATLAAGKKIQIIGISPDGWVRVRADDRKGWVDRHFLGPDITPKFALKASTAKACPTTLAKCPLNGCAAPDSDHAIFNIAKHGPPTGTLDQLTLKTFASLQKAADKVVGQGADLDKEDRETIRHLSVDGATLGEGALVEVSGFIVGKPHANSGESVNCGLKTEANNDIHISIAPTAASTEFAGIVVEMIPQDRNSNWTAAALQKVAKSKKRVRVVGQLFYDNLHRVNGNASSPMNGQPKRFALWEVHPITEFLVCTQTPCDVTKSAQWTKLEDM